METYQVPPRRTGIGSVRTQPAHYIIEQEGVGEKMETRAHRRTTKGAHGTRQRVIGHEQAYFLVNRGEIKRTKGGEQKELPAKRTRERVCWNANFSAL